MKDEPDEEKLREAAGRGAPTPTPNPSLAAAPISQPLLTVLLPLNRNPALATEAKDLAMWRLAPAIAPRHSDPSLLQARKFRFPLLSKTKFQLQV